MIPSDIRHTIVSHTTGLTSSERAIRAGHLCRVYGIVATDDRKTVAYLAGITEEMLV